ncbi:MAG TPA: type II toxin-antitoxin system PemK/MazF family toxin [Chloroflexota bacterium]|nr:type II toxin-antitoxin system PemK/MazF family toxin [Chloroflexota bacterium]
MIRQGDIYWFDFGVPRGSEPGYLRPIAVVQNDIANQSAIRTVLVCVLTTNLRLARARGNVLLDAGEGNLPRPTVANVSQVVTLDKRYLTDAAFIGTLGPERIDQIIAGIHLFL